MEIKKYKVWLEQINAEVVEVEAYNEKHARQLIRDKRETRTITDIKETK